MGKRSNFERKERDFYPTPYEAVIPLLPHLVVPHFVEPCAGDRKLVNHLESNGYHCLWASDIEPQHDLVFERDALSIQVTHAPIITNPPWDRKILHPMIEHFRKLAPTWLIFDADWKHTKQSSEYMRYCKKVVSVGRLKWIPDSKMTGKDNCAWYLFVDHETPTEFVGRS